MKRSLRSALTAKAILLVACTAAHANPADHFGGQARSAAVAALVEQAQAALGNGRAAQATAQFESAAAQEHAADIELGLVRSLLQAGRYRQALGFAAHTAGAHGEDTGGAALFAWLLAVAGQTSLATRVLDEAARRAPAEPLIVLLRRRLAPGALDGPQWPLPPAADASHFGPVAVAMGGVILPLRARAVSSGVLIDGGQRSLAPASAVAAASKVWVRNGLGETAPARLEALLPHGVALLRLDTPLSHPEPAAVQKSRPPFPGAPAYVVEYSGSAAGSPAWPWMRAGFIGSVEADGSGQNLGIDLPPGAHGGPVFDSSGRLVGMAMGAAPTSTRLLPMSLLKRAWGDAGGESMAQSTVVAGAAAQTTKLSDGRKGFDDIYEQGLHTALQILVDD
jgi:hypothetical protein